MYVSPLRVLYFLTWMNMKSFDYTGLPTSTIWSYFSTISEFGIRREYDGRKIRREKNWNTILCFQPFWPSVSRQVRYFGVVYAVTVQGCVRYKLMTSIGYCTLPQNSVSLYVYNQNSLGNIRDLWISAVLYTKDWTLNLHFSCALK